jgi:hypothetical protein
MPALDGVVPHILFAEGTRLQGALSDKELNTLVGKHIHNPTSFQSRS